MEGPRETNVSSIKEAPISMKSGEGLQASTPFSLDDVPLLTRESYATWKDKMEIFLKKEGLWCYIDGTIPEPDQDTSEYEVWLRRLEIIKSIFKLKCGSRTLPYIEELDTRLIWNQLVTMYEFTHPTNAGMKMESTRYKWCLPFYKAIVVGDWNSVSQFLSKNRGALTTILTPDRELPLHVAVQKGQVIVTKELLKQMSSADLPKQRKYGQTALHIAASLGNIEMVKAIVERDEKLVMIQSEFELTTPVMVAAWAGKKDVVHYLYEITMRQEANQKEFINSVERERARASCLCSLILCNFYELALDLLQRYPSLILTEDQHGITAIYALARRPYAFRSSFPVKRSRSGTLGDYFQTFIYSNLHVDAKNAWKHSRDVENAKGDGTQGNVNDIMYGLCVRNRNCTILQFWNDLSLCFRRLFQNALIKLVPGCKNIYEEKLKHYEASRLLKEVWRLVTDLDHDVPYAVEQVVVRAMFRAIQNGIVEFIEETINNWPQLLFMPYYEGQTAFHYAISKRQEKIFGLIHHLGPIKDDLARLSDASGNLMSHLAAKKAPIQSLNQVPGAALQMQRELLWYKEVESIMFPTHEFIQNKNRETPRTLFTEEHQELQKDGEKWMKDTATQCMVVATLITTVMFAAVFTIPGANQESSGHETGEPNYYIHGKFPIIFVISNILALCSSAASLLMFLAIITSRYAEEDFLTTLPQMLMLGLFFLFISIGGMMIAFVAAILVMLRSDVLWFSFPIIFIMACIPIITYALVELPLFIQLMFTTSSSHVFGVKKEIKYE